MGITVLLPGGFKPPHAKHYQLAKNFSKIPGVDKVLILIGPTPRNGVSREDSMAVWEILLKNDPQIRVVPTEKDNPMQAAYATVENSEDGGDFFLAAGSKDEKDNRLGQFIETWSRKVNGEKYNNFIKTGKEYPENPTPEEKNILPNKYYYKLRNKLTNNFPKEKGDVFTAVDLPQSEVKKAQDPMVYRGRDDEYEGKEFSATALRKDILNQDLKNFKTNYPNKEVDQKTDLDLSDEEIKKIYSLLNGKVVPEEPKAKKPTKKKHISEIILERAILRTYLRQLVLEGGNVFNDENDESATKRINQADVIPTVEWLEKITGLKLQNSLLGSTGKKETSGDLDIAIDPNILVDFKSFKSDPKIKRDHKTQFLDKAKDELISRIVASGKYTAQQKKTKDTPNPSKIYDISKSGVSVHFKTPILGNKDNGFVQTDFMFGDPNWMKFAQSAPSSNSKFKGVHRAMLTMSVATGQGYKFSTTEGLQNRSTGEFITDPDKIAKTILNPRATDKDFDSVETILAAIKDRPDYDELVKEAKPGGRYEFDKYDATFPEEDAMTKDEKTLNEILKKLITIHLLKEEEAKEPAKIKARIEHPEDSIYRSPKNGKTEAEKAIELIDKLQKDKSVLAGKWDGSPAVVFGIDENGKFFLTDKGGFTAKGYNGKATSREDVETMFKNRAINAAAKENKKREQDPANTKDKVEPNFSFASSMANAYDIFKNAWPKGLKGYFTGDVMYLKKPEIIDNKYTFKPNTVTYHVPINDPEYGKGIGASDAGVVLHSYTNEKGIKVGQLKDIKSYGFKKGGKLMVFPPANAKNVIEIDSSLLNNAKTAISKITDADVNKLFDSTILKSNDRKISDYSDLLYTFVNNMGSKMNELSAKEFINFIEKNPSLALPKKENVIKYTNENRQLIDDIFEVVKAVNDLKNSTIEQLDQQKIGLPASIDGIPGGEGYVVTDPDPSLGQIKLVNRGGFTAANRAKQR